VTSALPATGGVHAVHVGSGERLPNLAVAQRICEVSERPATLIAPVDDRPGHDRRYALDCSKLRAMGWAPSVPFEEGIVRTVRWYAENSSTWSHAATPEFARYFADQYAARLAVRE
jgi:dTDP-glucose 4,6-dehydratase